MSTEHSVLLMIDYTKNTGLFIINLYKKKRRVKALCKGYLNFEKEYSVITKLFKYIDIHPDAFEYILKALATNDWDDCINLRLSDSHFVEHYNKFITEYV